MKRTFLVIAITSFAATASHAQSSVTLYGLIDAGITYVNNQQGRQNWTAASGGASVNGNSWGLRGAEDLGGGMKALFTLESGFNVMNGRLGQGGRQFGREAVVGLSMPEAGTVTLGRQRDLISGYLGPLALTGTEYGGMQFAHPYDNDNLATSFRVNNSVKFESQAYDGLKFGGQYGFSNQAGGFANGRAYSAGASYSNGPFNLAAGYLQLNNNFGGTSPNPLMAVSGDNPLVAARQRTWGAGTNYVFGPATLGFVFTQTRLDGALGISSVATGAAGVRFTDEESRFNNYEINARYRLTPALSLSGAYTFTDSQIDGAKPKFHQFNLQTAYSFSKRTDVYLQGEYQRTSGLAGTGLGATINSVGMSSNAKQVSATAGIRQRF